MRAARVRKLEGAPLRVPLREPFVIATGRIDATRAVLVRAEVEDLETGARAEGLGEAAALPPVTREDEPDIAATVAEIGPELVSATDPLAVLSSALADRPVARAGIECAILDGLARARGVPMFRLLRPDAAPVPLRTDITIPIGTVERMAELAVQHAASGFDCFKVKVGKSAAHDRAALFAIHRAVPAARFRLDANEGFDAASALALLEVLLEAGLAIELFEQPCRREDTQGMAEVTARAAVPIVADESVRTLEDLERVIAGRQAHAVNLKLAKMGGLLPALAIAERARSAGLARMAGAMVETKLGLTAMAHLVTAVGGVDWLDLDTAFLLASDPFEGGYEASGPALQLHTGAGLAIAQRSN